ncbi:LuxR C-terminal-related transcriptional regulator [Streptomyces sp. NPDC052207]|uniref:helix-turn-helix transcriptional regulator n=1 Tax=Streptomyces sp. NPDC052207 TaxID=3155418 RepID=UPI003443BE5F
MDVTSDSPWTGSGLEPLSGRVLEYLVGRPSADRLAVADAVHASPEETARALGALEDALLVIRVDARPPRWKAVPPRSSLGPLLARKRGELARTELYMERLHEIYDAASGSQTHFVEAVEDGGEVAARYVHLLKSSSHEVLHLAKPPYVTGPADGPAHADAGQAAVRDGVRLRSVYETDGLTDTVSLETALRGTVGGGRLRLSAHVPIKLVLFDATTALLPLHSDRPSTGSLVVRSPALVHALVALFETIWEHATPATLESRQDSPVPRQDRETAQIDERTREILSLMATGMKDDAIARVLNVSRRTVQKHVSEAGSVLGARTRFQIALLAAERGWLRQGAGT